MMNSPTVTLLLEGLWDLLSDQWKEVLAYNLDLEGFFSQNDVDYLLTLTELDCSNSGITDLYPLYFMPQLEHLDISDTPVHNFSPIQSLTHLKSLSATFCHVPDTAVFSSLTSLEMLDISYPKVNRVDLEGVKLLSNLKELYCNGCAITSLDSLYNLPNLQTVSVFFNHIHEKEFSDYRKMNPDCWILK